MPRSRGSDIPQRQSPRGPPSLRTSSSDSVQLHQHHPPIANRSPKLGDRLSPRGTQSDPLNQKKLGTRIADLESQLGQAQEELKTLKEQLESAEAARRQAQEELEKKKSNGSALMEPGKFQGKNPSANVQAANDITPQYYADENQTETDVFEVPVEKMTVECNKGSDEVEKETKPSDLSNSPTNLVPDKQSLEDLETKNAERNMLNSKLKEKEKELKLMGKDNENLKIQLDEAISKLSSAQTKEQEMTSKLIKMEEELKTSKTNAAELTEKFQTVEGAKEALEAEMKKIRVQTEQWRKAADAAAAVLAGDVDTNGRIPERCGSMDKHFGNLLVQSTGGYAGFIGSPRVADDLDDGFGSGKRKGSGIRMFGELWKKRGQK